MNKLDPRAVWLFFIGSLICWFFVFLFFGLVFGSALLGIYDELAANDQVITIADFGSWLWILVVAWIIFSYVWARLTYYFYRYELTENGFRKEQGIIWKKYVTIPYERIQNVDIYRGIWARILGLSDLHIQTAGMSAVVGRYGARGAGAEGRLPGLSKQVAEQLRDELVQRARSPHPTSGL